MFPYNFTFYVLVQVLTPLKITRSFEKCKSSSEKMYKKLNVSRISSCYYRVILVIPAIFFPNNRKNPHIIR